MRNRSLDTLTSDAATHALIQPCNASHGSWQAYGLVGYDAWSKVALGAGYRYLSVNYEDDLFLFDVRLRGPVVGAAIHW